MSVAGIPSTRAQAYTLRRARAEDRNGVITMAANLWPGIDMTHRYRWLYEDNPAGRALTWVVTDDASGELAGVTSFFLWRMIAGGREVKAAIGGDGFVHPNFRRRGIATAMHVASRRAMAELGIEMMFGTPWPGNVTPLSKVETRDVVELVRYVRPLGARALGLSTRLDFLVRRALKPWRRGLALDELRGCDRRVDELWARTCGELDIATVRDAKFYDWHFRRAPGGSRAYVITDRGRPIAACALERVGNSVSVLDLLAPRDVWPRALSAILSSTNDADRIDIKLARPDAATRGLWKQGFVARERNPLNVMLPEGSPHAGLYFDPARWYVTRI